MWPVIGTVAAAVIVAASGYVGATYARRKEKAEAAKIIVDAALSLVEPLKSDAAEMKIAFGVLTARVAVVEGENVRLVTRVATLEVDNRNLRSENTGLRTRIGVLEHQITDLGHTPANGNGGQIVTKSTTESTTVTESA